MNRSASGAHRLLTCCMVVLLGCCPRVIAETTDRESVLQDAVDGHRPLRQNAAAQTTVSGGPLSFEGIPEAPDFAVLSRIPHLTSYPCSNCHQHLPVNPTPRTLAAPHVGGLEHGGGRFWCLQCHASDDRNSLQLLSERTVGFDDSWQLCGQCHYGPQADWAHGAHGKRVANWRGDRTVYACTHCHDPHAPAIAPRAPEPPPPLRHGLSPMHGAGDAP